MTGPVNIDSWFEFVIWAVLAVGSVIGALSAVLGLRKAHRTEVNTAEVRGEVKNDHKTNLRDDLDRTDSKVDAVDTKVDRLTGVVDAMHQEQRAFMRDIREQMARQDRIAARHHPDEA